MLSILATFGDDVYITSDLEDTKEGFLIRKGYKGNLQERFNGTRILDSSTIIPDKEVFYILNCFDPAFDQLRKSISNTGVNVYNPEVRRIINHSKKMAAANLLSSKLVDVKKPLTFGQIKRRFPEVGLLHHVTYFQAVDELGFLFGLKMFDKKRYICDGI